MSENAATELRPGGRDYLVPFPVAATTLGRSTDTFEAWAAKGLVPAVELEGGRKSTFASWLAAVMRSARPGKPGKLADVTAAWWAAHDEAAVLPERGAA
jgi:hypothetical protein